MKTELKDQIAYFYWNSDSKVYDVEVLDYIVAQLKTIKQVKAFCEMHNGGFLRDE